MKIKKAKGTKKCVTKRKLKFQDYKDCLKAARLAIKINYSEKKIKVSVDCLNLFGMGIFRAVEGMVGGEQKGTPPKTCCISHNDETWHNYTLEDLPKGDPKSI